MATGMGTMLGVGIVPRADAAMKRSASAGEQTTSKKPRLPDSTTPGITTAKGRTTVTPGSKAASSGKGLLINDRRINPPTAAVSTIML